MGPNISFERFPISCVYLSESGQYLATGETARLGVRAVVACWRVSDWSRVGDHQTHHAGVAALSIAPDDSHLVSLGCQDDQVLLGNSEL